MTKFLADKNQILDIQAPCIFHLEGETRTECQGMPSYSYNEIFTEQKNPFDFHLFQNESGEYLGTLKDNEGFNWFKSGNITEIVDKFSFLLSEQKFIEYLKANDLFLNAERFVFLSTEDNVDMETFTYAVVQFEYPHQSVYFFTDSTVKPDSSYRWNKNHWILSFSGENGVIAYGTETNGLLKLVDENKPLNKKGEPIKAAYGLAIHLGYVEDPNKPPVYTERDIHVDFCEERIGIPKQIFSFKNPRTQQQGKINVWGDVVAETLVGDCWIALYEAANKKAIFLLAFVFDEDGVVVSENYRILTEITSAHLGFIPDIETEMQNLLCDYKESKGFDRDAQIFNFLSLDDLKVENYTVIDNSYLLGKEISSYTYRNVKLALMSYETADGETYDWVCEINDKENNLACLKHQLSNRLRGMIDSRSSQDRLLKFRNFRDLLVEKGFLSVVAF